MQHPLFKSFVEDKWRSFNIQGWGSYVLKEKQKLLKGALKEWKKGNLGDLDKSIEEKKCELERLDIIDDTFGLDEEEARKRESVMEELLKESSWKESQLYQKARLKWISKGDVNSRFFHSWVNMRNKRNEINGIWSKGVWMESVRDVKSGFFEHFKSHFSSPQFCRPTFASEQFRRKLADAENALLIADFTEEEIKQAVWSIDSNGSPGPDGFTFGSSKATGTLSKKISC